MTHMRSCLQSLIRASLIAGSCAASGLRTLVLGRRQLSEEEWLEWEPQFLAAHAAVHDSSELLAQAAAKVCE